MFFALPVLIYSLFFLLGLELTLPEGNAFIFASLITVAISLWGIKKIGKKWIYLNIPFVLSLSSFALLYLIDSLFEKQIFILLSTALYYLGLLGIFRLEEYEKDQTARGMIAASSLTSAFFFYASTYGIYLNFLVPLWVLMTAYLLATVSITYAYFRIISNKKRIVWSYSIAVGMVMAEVAWIINFWPFGYLTTGVIVLMLYYVFWDLTQSYFLNLLSKKRLVANIILFSFLIGVVLFTSRWLPMV